MLAVLLGCGTARSSGTCANNHTISTTQLGSRVLGALRDRLLQPDLVAAFIEEYRREREPYRTTAVVSQASVAAKRAKVTGRIKRLTDIMPDRFGYYADRKARLATALAERDARDSAIGNAETEFAVAVFECSRWRRGQDLIALGLGCG
jgi:site-specific DNA recombinase